MAMHLNEAIFQYWRRWSSMMHFFKDFLGKSQPYFINLLGCLKEREGERWQGRFRSTDSGVFECATNGMKTKSTQHDATSVYAFTSNVFTSSVCHCAVIVIAEW